MRPIVGVLTALVGRWHGGPAQVSVLSSTLFGGVSGSAVADASAIGSLIMPWHRRLGYPMAFSAASLAWLIGCLLLVMCRKPFSAQARPIRPLPCIFFSTSWPIGPSITLRAWS